MGGWQGDTFFFFFLAVAKISYERSNFSSRLFLLPSSVSKRSRDPRRAWMTHRGSNVRALAHDSSWGSASPIARGFYIQSSSPAPRKYHVYLPNGWAEGARPLDGGGQLVTEMGAGPGAGDAGTQGMHVHTQSATASPMPTFAARHACPRHKAIALTLSYCCRAEAGPSPARPTAAPSPL